ncbi:MAG TPA: hypothetical protein VFG65_05495 [Fimbriimonadales bacterium]|nr:hypothetical protein [Fimbriimonadales bacterium]
MKRHIFVAIGALVLGGVLAAPLKAQGQDPRTQIVPSLELQDADVRDALRLLFESVGVTNYTIANDVQGRITVKLTNVPFENALRNVLNQVDATWSIEAGIYQIKRREQPPAPGTGPTNVEPPAASKVLRKIQINHADPQLIAYLLSGDLDFGITPEISTLNGAGGGGFGNSGGFGGQQGGYGGGMGGFGGGLGGFGGGGFGGGGLGGGFGGGGFGGGGFGGGGFGGGGFGGGGFGGGGRF